MLELECHNICGGINFSWCFFGTILFELHNFTKKTIFQAVLVHPDQWHHQTYIKTSTWNFWKYKKKRKNQQLIKRCVWAHAHKSTGGGGGMGGGNGSGGGGKGREGEWRGREGSGGGGRGGEGEVPGVFFMKIIINHEQVDLNLISAAFLAFDSYLICVLQAIIDQWSTCRFPEKTLGLNTRLVKINPSPPPPPPPQKKNYTNPDLTKMPFTQSDAKLFLIHIRYYHIYGTTTYTVLPQSWSKKLLKTVSLKPCLDIFSEKFSSHSRQECLNEVSDRLSFL